MSVRKRPIRYRRGKPIPKLAVGDVLDLSTFPLRSRPRHLRPIEICPDCGRKGEPAIYESGNRAWTHVIRYEGIFWFVVESCFLPAAANEMPAAANEPAPEEPAP